MRLTLLVLLAGCMPLYDDVAQDLSRPPDIAMCSGPLNPSDAPPCCPGICYQDDCCDPNCYGPLVGGKCTPGTVCAYDFPNLKGTFTCGFDGKLWCGAHPCTDLGL